MSASQPSSSFLQRYLNKKSKEGMKNFPSTSQTAEMSSPVNQRPQLLHNACAELPETALPEKTYSEDYHPLCLPNCPPGLFSI